MELPPEGIWKYPPTQAFIWTTVIAFGGLWIGLGEPELGGLAKVVMVTIASFSGGAVNALFVENVVQRERRVAAGLRMEMLLHHTPNKRDDNAHRT